jgi:hypothetical protein
MAKKHKGPERADQCVSLADKIAFSLMVRSKLQALSDDPWSCPSDYYDMINKYHDENCAWSHP